MKWKEEKQNYYYIPQLQSVACWLVSTSIPNSDCFKNQAKNKKKMFSFRSGNYTQFCTQIVSQDLMPLAWVIFFFSLLFSSCQTAQTTMLIKCVLGKNMENLLEIKLAKLRLKRYLSNCLFFGMNNREKNKISYKDLDNKWYANSIESNNYFGYNAQRHTFLLRPTGSSYYL